MKKPLPVADAPDGLGRTTIMDRSLAARHGVAYVHLAAFAIDVDRIREHVDALDDDAAWPFGWEVYLTACYLAARVDPEAHRELLEDACTSVIEGGEALGAQLPFAVWVLVARGVYPAGLRAGFRTWKRPPDDLAQRLAPLFASERAAELADACVAVALSPPLAPPTEEALAALAAR